jgi:hypothetical protein
MPNALGTIWEEPSRLSITPKQLDRGRTWGVNDSTLNQAKVYRAQTARANQLVEMIQRKNAASYGRKA